MAVHHRHVGRPVPRAEGRDKVSGRTTYAGDVTLPGMLWGKALRSPVACGRIKRIDTSRAERLEGVKAVVTGKELRGRRIGRRIRDMPILADDVVRFVGEKVAAVAAATQQTAQEATELIDVEYEELEPVLDPLEAMELSAVLIHPEVMSYEGLPDPLTAPTNTFVHVRWAKGDVAQGFRQSELIVERTYRTQLVHQGYIEPHTCVVKGIAGRGRGDLGVQQDPAGAAAAGERRAGCAVRQAPRPSLRDRGRLRRQGRLHGRRPVLRALATKRWAGEDDHGLGRGVRRRQPAPRRRHPREDGSDPGRSPHEPAHGLRVRQRSLRRIQTHGSAARSPEGGGALPHPPTRCRKSGWSTPTRFPAAICAHRAIPRACSPARARWTWWRGSWAWTRWSSGEST